ncbi:MAG: peptide ABC transporter substrate-binding protein [Thermomicrobiales bacterium]
MVSITSQTERIGRRAFVKRSMAVGIGLGGVIAAPALAARGRAATAQSPEAAPADQQVLRTAIYADWNMDPQFNGGQIARTFHTVYRPLTHMNAAGELVPGVAETWETTDGGTSWTFVLNKGAKFSDGSPITASDVKFSLSRLTDPNTKSFAGSTLQDVVGYEEVRSGETTELSGIEVGDDQTVRIRLKAPRPYFPAVVAEPAGSIVKRDNVLEGGEEWWRTPVTSGVYMVSEYTVNERMVLVPSLHWWGGQPQIQQIEVVKIGDPGTALIQYENNELDVLWRPNTADIGAALAGGELTSELVMDSPSGAFYFGFNVKNPPFDDIKVREAFAKAVDVPSLSEVALRGMYPAADRLMEANMVCYQPEQLFPTYDPAGAQQALAESSYKDAQGLPPIAILVSEAGGQTSGPWTTTAVAIQQMLQENLSVTIEVQQRDASMDIEYLQQNGQVFRASIGGPIPDAAGLSQYLLSGAVVNRASLYANPSVDELVNQALSNPDEVARCEAMAEAERLHLADYPYLAFFGYRGHYFVKPWVRNLSIYQDSMYRSFEAAYVAKR